MAAPSGWVVILTVPGKGCEADIELLRIGIAHGDGLFVGVITLGNNSENILARSHEQAITKGPVQTAERKLCFGLGIDIQGQ